MIITTTPNIEGYEITEYLGIVGGNIDIIYGQDELVKLAEERNADAVVGIKSMSYVEVTGNVANSTIYYVTIGTAVKIRKK